MNLSNYCKKTGYTTTNRLVYSSAGNNGSTSISLTNGIIQLEYYGEMQHAQHIVIYHSREMVKRLPSGRDIHFIQSRPLWVIPKCLYDTLCSN
jgi:hypothetical protein